MADVEHKLLESGEEHRADGCQRTWNSTKVRRGLLATAAAGGVFWLIVTTTRRSKGIAGGASLLAAAQSDAPTPKIKVELYGMAGCPYTRAFMEGPLTETLNIVPEYLDFTFVPFGNSYYQTEACGGSDTNYPFDAFFKGYNETARKCWDERCGAAAEVPAGDCFTGKLLCQHGATDGMVTKAWACAKAMAREDPAKYWPFVQCTSRRYLAITTDDKFRDAVQECSAPHFNKYEMLACATTGWGTAEYNRQGRLTIPHAGVPYLLVDGKPVDDVGCVACGDGIMQKVCEGLRDKHGLVNDICAGIFGLP